MSSLRNSLHRPNHKERSQLSNRSRFGILEKHKDYVLRARDYHSKQDRLQRLREKASLRNKDEFYFSMLKERTRGGVHVQSRGNAALPVDVVKILKTQDENYIRTKRAHELKKIDQLKASLGSHANVGAEDQIYERLTEVMDDHELDLLRTAGFLSSSRSKSRHIVFVEDNNHTPILQQPLPQNRDEPAQELEEDVDLGWTDGNDKDDTGLKQARINSSARIEDAADAILKAGEKERLDLLKELAGRLKRERLLRYTQRELEMQRLLMGKGSRKKLQGLEKQEGDGLSLDVEDEDELDSRKGRAKTTSTAPDEISYRPRVYKWRLERKK